MYFPVHTEYLKKLITACGQTNNDKCAVPDGGKVQGTFSVENFADRYPFSPSVRLCVCVWMWMQGMSTCKVCVRGGESMCLCVCMFVCVCACVCVHAPTSHPQLI